MLRKFLIAAGAPPPLPSEVSKRAPGRPKGSGNKQQKPASWHGAQSWGHYKAQVKFVTKAVDAKKQKDSGADVGMTLQQAKDHLQSEGINLSRSAIHMLAKKPGQSPNKVGRPATLPSEAGQKLADFVLALRAQRIPVTKDIVLAYGNAMATVASLQTSILQRYTLSTPKKQCLANGLGANLLVKCNRSYNPMI